MFYKNRTQIYYQTITLLMSLAENILNTILVWLIYKNIHNSLIMSLVTFTSYFPMFISVLFIYLADKINPIKQAYINNIISYLICLLLCVTLLFNFKITTYVTILLIIQFIFSYIKTINKIIYNKIIKILFKLQEREKVIQFGWSVNQISQIISNLISNFLIIYNLDKISFILVGIIYFVNLICSIFLFQKNKNLKENTLLTTTPNKVKDKNFFFG